MHLLSIDDLDKSIILHLLSRTNDMKTLTSKPFQHRILTLLMYEPSTRTSGSFQAAMLKLGGSVLNIPIEMSSVQKGETLHDTLRTVCCYSDIVVMRHPQIESIEAAKVATKPILNAGNGAGEHPTQALLDLYTIQEELGRLHDITVTFVGDLTYGRTVHSLVRLLVLFPNIRFKYVSSLPMPPTLVDYVSSLGIEQQCTTLEEALPESDVVYMTRIQKERVEFQGKPECLNAEKMKLAKQHMIVMHPFPRNEELSTDIDTDPRSVYFKQLNHGMYMRMAILEYYLSKEYGATSYS